MLPLNSPLRDFELACLGVDSTMTQWLHPILQVPSYLQGALIRGTSCVTAWLLVRALARNLRYGRQNFEPVHDDSFLADPLAASRLSSQSQALPVSIPIPVQSKSLGHYGFKHKGLLLSITARRQAFPSRAKLHQVQFLVSRWQLAIHLI